MATKRPPRLHDFTYVGLCAYFLTICVRNRAEVFAVRECADVVSRQLLIDAASYGFAVIAYCVMPDHVHALVEATREDADFRKFASMFKQRTAFEYRKTHDARLWQEGYYEHVVRDDEPILGIASYILHNPIRAGLCETIEAYPQMGSQRYTIAELMDAVQFVPDRSDRRSRP